LLCFFNLLSRRSRPDINAGVYLSFSVAFKSVAVSQDVFLALAP
jgi:hypothetical protein